MHTPKYTSQKYLGLRKLLEIASITGFNIDFTTPAQMVPFVTADGHTLFAATLSTMRGKNGKLRTNLEKLTPTLHKEQLMGFSSLNQPNSTSGSTESDST